MVQGRQCDDIRVENQSETFEVRLKETGEFLKKGEKNYIPVSFDRTKTELRRR